MNYAMMAKLADFRRVLETTQHAWACDTVEVPKKVLELIEQFRPWLPLDQMSLLFEVPDHLLKKQQKEGVWRVKFKTQSADELRLVQLGIQPEETALYLQMTFELCQYVPVDFVRKSWEVIARTKVIVGPVVI